jgi:hypothetical protein
MSPSAGSMQGFEKDVPSAEMVPMVAMVSRAGSMYTQLLLLLLHPGPTVWSCSVFSWHVCDDPGYGDAIHAQGIVEHLLSGLSQRCAWDGNIRVLLLLPTACSTCIGKAEHSDEHKQHCLHVAACTSTRPAITGHPRRNNHWVVTGQRCPLISPLPPSPTPSRLSPLPPRPSLHRGSRHLTALSVR